MAEFKAGDTVRLKSGGPVMTVAKLMAGKYDVYWFNQIGAEYTIQTVTLQGEMLEAAKPLSKPL